MRENSAGIPAKSEGIVGSRVWEDEDLVRLSAPARNQRRMAAEIRDQVLVDLCAHVPLSLEQLAALMERSESYLREPLRALIAARRLTFLYPERPNHPRQRYTISSRTGSSA